MTVLVIGATGKSGRPVVEALLARGVKVAAASRNPEGVFPADSGVIPVRFDWADRTTWAPALDGAEAVYIVGPYAHPVGERLVGDLLAEAHDTRRVVLLSVIGAELLPDEAMMAHWERSVRASGKEWTILHPNWFFQNFGTAFVPALLGRGLELDAADALVSFVDTRDIAAVAAVVLAEGGFAGQTLTITGPQSLSHADVVAILGEAAGRTLAYRAIPPEQAAAGSRAAGVRERTIVAQRGLFQVMRDGGNAPVTDVVERLTGRAPRTLAQYAAENAEVWRAE